MAELLLAKGADVNANDDSGITPLFVAVERGHKEMVQFLINNKADVNAKDSRGETILDRNYFTKNKDIEELLKKAGAKE